MPGGRRRPTEPPPRPVAPVRRGPPTAARPTPPTTWYRRPITTADEHRRATRRPAPAGPEAAARAPGAGSPAPCSPCSSPSPLWPPHAVVPATQAASPLDGKAARRSVRPPRRHVGRPRVVPGALRLRQLLRQLCAPARPRRRTSSPSISSRAAWTAGEAAERGLRRRRLERTRLHGHVRHRVAGGDRPGRLDRQQLRRDIATFTFLVDPRGVVVANLVGR